MTEAFPLQPGGSADAIRHHYDVGNDFYAAWLDPTMVYSCALWDGPEDQAPLEEAQRRKLIHHARAIKAAPGMNILDIGCGWGGQLRMLVEEFGVTACTGLTLSEEQAAHVRALGLDGASVELVNWHDYAPAKPFDGIISVGAFEHFAHPTQSEDERRATYRRFFQSCHDWTAGRGRLSLQTIAYGTMQAAQANPFITGDIFPAAELPTVEDIVVASRGLFRILLLRDDGLDYARTCTLWAQRLRTAMAESRAGDDAELAQRYHRYLRLSAAGFAMGRIGLLRIVFDPIAPARGAA
ncbi:cyclopropane-fatty-acyl-phospholipid synthase family protein [Sphingobium sufflavum]|uniref:SAM-dependent methyltransferase n=1 Tax=Sphingobium sufflavum TaxID=1129547 RepID=UPI001F38341D|nr:cyclopropane-fatty-acyl-phospholipid synthase family protein [Sphingobium sufflavum]MCE7797103.1 cyclopropane-fatty-acyl-phospholipid synthase family protein [Sphingobium sufflavum]